MDGEIPVFVLVLLGGLALAFAGLLSSFAETRAVRSMKQWPFLLGIPVVRFRVPPGALPPSPQARLTESAEVRVVSPGECIFVSLDWRSHLSWSYYPAKASPYSLKGHAVVSPGGSEVVGRLSLAASIGIPGVIIWLGGCGLLALPRSPAMSVVLLFVGVILPLVGTWFSLPKEIQAFRRLWDEVRVSLGHNDSPLGARGAVHRDLLNP